MVIAALNFSKLRESSTNSLIQLSCKKLHAPTSHFKQGSALTVLWTVQTGGSCCCRTLPLQRPQLLFRPVTASGAPSVPRHPGQSSGGCQGAACPGTKGIPPSFPRAGMHHQVISTQGQVQAWGTQNSARPLLALTSGSTPNTRPEREFLPELGRDI